MRRARKLRDAQRPIPAMLPAPMAMSLTTTGPRLLRPLLIALAVVGTAAACAIAFYQPVRMYYAGLMRVNDYGIYTNFLWNSAHGELFRYLVNMSYLEVHLSYTLLLLAPLFRVWDHPFLLTFLQSALLAGGTGIMALLARRQGLGLLPASGLLLLFAGYPMIQRVVLCDFHGVCLYFVLIPWLYHAARYRRRLAWLPLLLILGLREEAGLAVAPMLAWIAARDRWRAGWIMAAAAVGYTAFACLFLYEYLHGFSLAEMPRRGHYFDPSASLASHDLDGLWRRAQAIFWLYLPGLPWLRRGRAALPILLFPLLALLPLLFSLDPRVHGLAVQYPAIVQVSVWMGLLEALRGEAPLAPRRAMAIQATLLGVVAFATGVLGTGVERDRYAGWRPDPEGVHAEWVAGLIPRDGRLLTTSAICGYCANRRDLYVLPRSGPPPEHVDHIFVHLSDLAEARELQPYLQDDAFGVRYFDFEYVILSRGASHEQTPFVRDLVRHPDRILMCYRMQPRSAENVPDPQCGWARYWPGLAQASPTNAFAAGLSVKLPAGRYLVCVRYRTDPQEVILPAAKRGVLELHLDADRDTVVAQPLEPGPGSGDYFEMVYALDLPEPAKVKPVALGGAARLWLDTIAFVERPAELPARPRPDGP